MGARRKPSTSGFGIRGELQGLFRGGEAEVEEREFEGGNSGRSAAPPDPMQPLLHRRSAWTSPGRSWTAGLRRAS